MNFGKRKIERRDICCLCGKNKQEVRKLIVGLHGAVCSECVDRFEEIVSLGSEAHLGPKSEHGSCCLCGKTKDQARTMAVGRFGAICSDCIDICRDILSGAVPPSLGSQGPRHRTQDTTFAPHSSLLSKTFIVCGASSGIGRATALALSSFSAELVLVARRKPLLEELSKKCEANGAKATYFPCDITSFPECEEMIKAARALGPDSEPVLVNSAGVAEFGEFATTPVTSIDDQIKTNLLGPIYACRAVLPWILEVGKGQIINVLSVAATNVFSGAAAYSASKAGLLMFGKSLAAEYRALGLRLTSVLPGATDTDIWAHQDFVPKREDMLAPEAVARCIVDIIVMPADRTVDEITLMPPKGVL